MKVAISIIIVTKDRPRQLLECLSSFKKSVFTNFELIVVDQSKSNLLENQIKNCLKKNSKVNYLKSGKTGKSKGLNEAIALSSASLLAFTDDDCIVDKNWLKTIYETFQKDKKIAGIFGRTTPYQPSKHKGLICPSTFDHRQTKYIEEPCKHWEEIGFGNNMAWRKSFFTKFGNFKEWLGPGSIGSNAEDAETALRALINKQTIFYNPKMRVSHNKWLDEQKYQKQMLSYICGGMACYGYLALNGQQIGKNVIKADARESIQEILNILKTMKIKIQAIKKVIAKITGFTVAVIYHFQKIKILK